MYLNDDFKTGPALTLQKKFELILVRQPNSDVYITSCNVVGTNFRHSIAFTENTKLDAVLVRRVASQIERCLTNLDQRVHVASLPTFVIETDHLTLGAARIKVLDWHEGRSDIVLRFDFFHGRVADAFDARIGFHHAHECECGRLAERVLTDITLPVLNICEAADLALLTDGSPMAAFLEHMVAHSIELKFQVELIRRFADRFDPTDREDKALSGRMMHLPSQRVMSQSMPRKSA